MPPQSMPSAQTSAILVLNAGSSSLKYKLFRDGRELLAGHIAGIGAATSTSMVRVRSVQSTMARHTPTIHDALSFALAIVKTELPHEHIAYVAHRVVHGGERFTHHTVINPEVEVAIEELGRLAPLHNPSNLAGIRAARTAMPHAVHIACFDTAFHHTIPRFAFLYGLPYKLYEELGIRKYGFHGLSHEYSAHKAFEITRRSDRVITCHLGAGSSLCAIHHGLSHDTTMGFTPLDGLLMATRAGELDPDIPLFLMKEQGLSIEQVETLLNTGSGLKGLTGSADLREVKVKADAGNEISATAIEMLCYRIALHIGGYTITVGGVRTITFSGGIGENAAWLRARVCELLAPLGVLLDPGANERHAQTISSPASRVTVLVIPANEEQHMANIVIAGRFIIPDEPYNDTPSNQAL